MESSFNHQSFFEMWRDFESPRLPSTHWSVIWRTVCSVPDRSAHLCARTAIAVLLQSSSARAASVIIWVGGVGGGECTGLHKLHVVGWEHSKMAIWAVASPPALVYHLDPGDDIVRIERDLGVVSWRTGAVMNISKVTVWYTFSNTTLLEF